MGFNEERSSHPAPKGATLRVTFYWAIFAFLGHFLGHFLPKIPHRTLCKGFRRRGRDSNSWYGYPYGSLANCWFQPLTHLSGSRLAKLRHKDGLQRYKFFPKSKEICAKGGRFAQKTVKRREICAETPVLAHISLERTARARQGASR